MPVGDDALVVIQDAAHDAFVGAWDAFLKSEDTDAAATQTEVANVGAQAHTAAHEAVRRACADLGVTPREYYLADPGAASSCEPECAEKWPEVPEDRIHRDEADTNLAWFDTERILTEQAVNAHVGGQAADAGQNDHQIREAASGTQLGEDSLRLIAASTRRAADRVRDETARARRTRPAADHENADIGHLVHEAQHQAVRDTSAALGVDPGSYYRAVPDSTADCEVRCLDEWPELNDAAYHRDSEDDRLARLDDGALDDLDAREIAHEMEAAAREAQGVDLDDLKALYDSQAALEEEPPDDDLSRGIGAGY
ncbi:hypothetical protein NQK81_01150 [Amycolatopsis roodepoortensis]|uniref:hypothetical protein n=1 Tax=Amycolatopsis roodepoortensis TaxID=700274 RepID=UPI00214C5CDB|nr:hypothetical protein [Amycolatopsis roodepoortensis]UUV32081.1 hypothetical protein NQK81_01150 [Amycolatopsis roodepoortensis]